MATKPSTATNPFARRRAGKREWKLTAYELIEAQQRVLQILRSIGDKHPNDAPTQRLVAQASLEVADTVSKAHELLQYGEEKPTNDTSNGDI